MNAYTVIYQTRKFKKYEMESIFEKGKFIKMDEEFFDNTVVKYRNQYDMKYIEGGQEFIEKETGLRIRRYYK